ncbi:ATP-binding protein [Calidifontibacter sp. DB0510]|uniref:ATP-binding protein n=1 Tax=Metallococcus carri TaxID=1656884 RepID=A0A967B4P1_9MICO|nr:ATP-binding protein [Metallococcus carri]NHN57220.1 ATP-binding protein [Metallococcus carri]NOP37977.1 ATP-binding protein [Calidifontibacter sp. DB2511S]
MSADEHSHDSWVRTVRLPFTTESVPEVRQAVREDLAGSQVPADVIEETETVVSELVANAILHGRPLPDGTVRVHWKVRPPRIELEVSDGGGERHPVPKPQVPWAASGRGLRIVRSLAHEWGVADEDGRTTVWAAMGGPSRRRL